MQLSICGKIIFTDIDIWTQNLAMKIFCKFGSGIRCNIEITPQLYLGNDRQISTYAGFYQQQWPYCSKNHTDESDL